jgi:hypothetical protein
MIITIALLIHLIIEFFNFFIVYKLYQTGYKIDKH